MIHSLDRLLIPLAIATCAALFAAFGLIFFWAPVELTMGISQKIFYVHVPAAMASYAGFILCALSSMAYLLKPQHRWDAIARSGAELGLLFCLFVLISGPLWAYKAWGKPWVWDAQLTSTLVLFLLYTAYVTLRALSPPSRSIRTISAVLGAISCAVIPFIHYAVKLWGGLHPVVQREGGGGLSREMSLTFSVSMLATLLLFTCLTWMLVRARLTEARIDALHLELTELQLARSSAHRAAAR